MKPRWIEINYAYRITVLPRRMPLEEFLKSSRVTAGSYAEEFSKRVFSCLFEYSLDMVYDYEKYFGTEYTSFAEYLYWRYGLEKTLAEEISHFAEQGCFVGYGRDTLGIYEEMDFERMLESVFSSEEVPSED